MIGKYVTQMNWLRILMSYSKCIKSRCCVNYTNSFICSTAFENRLSVAILRLPEGLDYSRIIEEDEQAGISSVDLTLSQPPSRGGFLRSSSSTHVMHADSNLDISHLGVSESIVSSAFPTISTATRIFLNYL